MKKNVLVILFVILVLPLSVFSLSDDYEFTYGDWQLNGSRVYQSSTDCGIAKAVMVYPQQGVVEYNFNVRYEDGLFDDGHAGFGIHIFVNKPAKGFSWGEGQSYLIWLNYDENPVSKDIPAGLSAQVYQSKANWKMDLIQSVSLSGIQNTILKYPKNTIVPIKIVADGNTGLVKLYDPINSSLFYTLKLNNTAPLKGQYVTLRTNSGAFSFGR